MKLALKWNQINNFKKTFNYEENDNTIKINKANKETIKFPDNMSTIINQVMKDLGCDIKIDIDCVKLNFDPINTIIFVDEMSMNLLQYIILNHELSNFGESFEMRKLYCKAYYTLCYGLENNVSKIDKLFSDESIYDKYLQEIIIEKKENEMIKNISLDIFNKIKFNKYLSLNDIESNFANLDKTFIYKILRDLEMQDKIFYVKCSELFFYNKK